MSVCELLSLLPPTWLLWYRTSLRWSCSHMEHHLHFKDSFGFSYTFQHLWAGSQSLRLIQCLPEMLEEHVWNQKGSLNPFMPTSTFLYIFWRKIKSCRILKIHKDLTSSVLLGINGLIYTSTDKNSMDRSWPFLDILPPCDTYNKLGRFIGW